MAICSGLITSCAVYPKLPIYPKFAFKFWASNASRPRVGGFPLISKKMEKTHHSIRGLSGTNYIRSVGSNDLSFTYRDGAAEEPYWSTKIKEFLRGLQFLLAFLAEQPGQLKYIEWPSLQSTLKTATLTLILVAFLIVALTSVDAALSYVLAWFLRRNPVT